MSQSSRPNTTPESLAQSQLRLQHAGNSTGAGAFRPTLDQSQSSTSSTPAAPIVAHVGTGQPLRTSESGAGRPARGSGMVGGASRQAIVPEGSQQPERLRSFGGDGELAATTEPSQLDLDVQKTLKELDEFLAWRSPWPWARLTANYPLRINGRIQPIWYCQAPSGPFILLRDIAHLLRFLFPALGYGTVDEGWRLERYIYDFLANWNLPNALNQVTLKEDIAWLVLSGCITEPPQGPLFVYDWGLFSPGRLLNDFNREAQRLSSTGGPMILRKPPTPLTGSLRALPFPLSIPFRNFSVSTSFSVPPLAGSSSAPPPPAPSPLSAIGSATPSAAGDLAAPSADPSAIGPPISLKLATRSTPSSSQPPPPPKRPRTAVPALPNNISLPTPLAASQLPVDSQVPLVSRSPELALRPQPSNAKPAKCVGCASTGLECDWMEVCLPCIQAYVVILRSISAEDPPPDGFNCVRPPPASAIVSAFSPPTRDSAQILSSPVPALISSQISSTTTSNQGVKTSTLTLKRPSRSITPPAPPPPIASSSTTSQLQPKPAPSQMHPPLDDVVVISDDDDDIEDVCMIVNPTSTDERLTSVVNPAAAVVTLSAPRPPENSSPEVPPGLPPAPSVRSQQPPQPDRPA